jgi:hypothetical protein
MLGSQLLELIKSLDKRDMRELRKVVRSPYFNQREDVSQLFDCIDTTLNTRLPDLSKEKIFEKIYPYQKYDDVLIRQLMSYLYKVIQKYLITEGVLNNQDDSQLYLIQALSQRKSYKIFEKNINEASDLDHKNMSKKRFYHFIKYRLLNEEYEYLVLNKRHGDFNLQSLSDELDNFYISERLRLACIIQSHQAVSKKEYKQPFLNLVIDTIEREDNWQLSISAYYLIYKTMIHPEDEVSFLKLKNTIEEKIHLLSELEQRDLVISATNYCIKRLNNGEKRFGIEALNMYRYGLETKSLFDNNVLLPFLYKNILMLALKSEEYEWAEKFLYDFKQYLPEKERENIFQYNLALFYFRTGKYSEAMTLLQKVNLNDVLYNLDARRLLARIYYDLDEINALQSLIESSKVYLHRQKGIGYHHDMYTNYFRFLEKMMKMDMKKAEARLILRGEVESTQLLAEREWLLQKLS